MIWFYEEHGVRKGPVSTSDIQDLIAQGSVVQTTLCWTESFGGEWRVAARCPFWPSPTDGGPPALPASIISNRWLWLSLFGPLLGSLVFSASAITGLLPDSAPDWLSAVLGAALMYGAIIMDHRSLVGAGFRPGSLLWIVILPLYFWRRVRIVGHGMGFFFFSVLVFLWTFPNLFYGWSFNPLPFDMKQHSYQL